MLKRILLGCGLIAPVWWVAMDVIGSRRYSGYSYLNQTISELSAQGAPTRVLMTVVSGLPYALLMGAFGVGIWLTAGERPVGRLTAAFVTGEALWGFVGGLAFPMAMREVMAAGQDTLRNQLHGPYGIGMPVLFILAVIFGSRLFGKRFRLFSAATIVVLLVFGLLTSLQMGAVQANEATPWLGVIERTNAYAAMLWIAVLAGMLLRSDRLSQRTPRDVKRSTLTPKLLPR
jgi:hypothetical protein